MTLLCASQVVYRLCQVWFDLKADADVNNFFNRMLSEVGEVAGNTHIILLNKSYTVSLPLKIGDGNAWELLFSFIGANGLS